MSPKKHPIKQEIDWCQSNRGSSGKGESFEDGFVEGLKQALRLLQEMQANGQHGPQQLWAWWNGEQDVILQTISQATDGRGSEDALGVEPIHEWFELSYAQYLTIPRSVLQSMPVEWQRRFVKCLHDLDETIDWRPQEGAYRVTLCTIEEIRDEDGYSSEEWGHEIHDPLQDYERGRRRVPCIDGREHS